MTHCKVGPVTFVLEHVATVERHGWEAGGGESVVLTFVGGRTLAFSKPGPARAVIDFFDGTAAGRVVRNDYMMMLVDLMPSDDAAPAAAAPGDDDARPWGPGR